MKNGTHTAKHARMRVDANGAHDREEKSTHNNNGQIALDASTHKNDGPDVAASSYKPHGQRRRILMGNEETLHLRALSLVGTETRTAFRHDDANMT